MKRCASSRPFQPLLDAQAYSLTPESISAWCTLHFLFSVLLLYLQHTFWCIPPELHHFIYKNGQICEIHFFVYIVSSHGP